MTRTEVYHEIDGMFGEVPSFFQVLPDATLELEWELFRRVQFEEGPIPNKYRELLGLAVSAVRGCQYCAYYHTEVAKLNGATEEEIEDAVHFAKSSVGWSTYLHGMQIPFQQFKEEVDRACAHVREQSGVGAGI